jgi:fumarate reductase flavoprotein subunit
MKLSTKSRAVGKAAALLACCALALSACSSAPQAAPNVKDGSYETKAEGKNGDVTVSTTIKGGRIAAVKVIAHNETPGISDPALAQVPAAIVKANKITVDTVSGATYTSKAIIGAVKAAIILAGGSDSDFTGAKAAVKAGKAEEYSCDVAVVGGGGSGISAAVSAGDKGAKVILIEKTGVLGGASLLSWASLGYGSSYQKEAGANPDKEKFIQTWIADRHWRLDVSILRRFIDESGPTIDWLRGKGWNFSFISWFDGGTGHMLPPYAQRPGLWASMLDASVVKRGGAVLTNTTGKSLITDKEGKVVGVVAQKADGTPVRVMAKAVIIATGGYSGNKEMVEKAFGFGGINGGLPQNVGEGLEMAWKAGAAKPQNFGGQMLHQTLARAKLTQFSAFENKYPMILAYVPSVLNVGATGARFRDEGATLVAVAAANTSAFQGSFHYVIVSKKTIDTLASKGLAGIGMDVSPGMPPEYKPKFELGTPWTNAYAVFDAMVAGGWGYKGNSLEELAKNAGMDKATFVETYENYEKLCASGVDGEFGKAPKYLFANGEEGPFYAITAEINNLGSVGGLLINKRFQVLNARKLPVGGLYAVGCESEGVLYNDTYVGNGAGIGWALTSGRLGGSDAAEAVLAK